MRSSIIKNTLAKGTLILTAAGFLSRILGFFYRIWLSEHLGSELLGIYQMIFPVSGVCYTIYASGIQTAISKITAERKASLSVLFHGLSLSLFLALLLSFLLYEGAPFLATHFLFEERTTRPLRLLSFMFPFGAITACCNGYNYGRSNSKSPAISQLTEQIIRIACAYFIAYTFQSLTFSCELAVLVLVIGEIASALISIFSLISGECKGRKLTAKSLQKNRLKELALLAMPLTFHRLIINLLHSFEATLVPFTLVQSGMTKVEALSQYGILNGMAFPFIFFPTAITGSLSVLLLPVVSRANKEENTGYLNKVIRFSSAFSVCLGLACTVFFLIAGNFLGITVFHEPTAGRYICILAWLCPFMYLSSTLGSILNGLGKVYQTFSVSVLSLCIKIGFLVLFVPKYGMPAYFFTLLVSQGFTTIAESILLVQSIHKQSFSLQAVES